MVPYQYIHYCIPPNYTTLHTYGMILIARGSKRQERYTSMYAVDIRTAQTQSRYVPRQYLTIEGNITEFRYNAVFEQLTVELSVTGSRYEYWSRNQLIIRRVLSWYQLDTGLVRMGTRVSIDVIKTLEIVGCR